MQHNIPRRSFLLAWLGGLLAGWLGRSQTHAAPTPPTPEPLRIQTEYDATPEHVTTCTYDAFGRLVEITDNGHVNRTVYDATARE